MKMKTFAKVLKYIGGYWYLVVLSIIASLASVVMSLLIPILAGEGIDCLIGPGVVDFDGLKTILERLAVVIIVGLIWGYALELINNRLCFSVAKKIRNDAINQIEKLPVSYIDSHPVGDITSRVITDVDQFTDGLLLGMSQIFTGVITIAGTLIFMFGQSIQITLLVIMVTPLSIFVAMFISKKTYKHYVKQAKIRGEQTSYIDEMISQAKVVKSLGYEENAIERFDEINGRFEKTARRALFYSSLTNPTTRFVNSIVYAIVVLFGALSCLNGTFTVGALSCFLNYAGKYTKPFNEISGVIAEFQNALACAARVFELIEERIETDAENAKELNTESLDGDVKIQNVDFSYVSDKKLIENLNLSVKAGQKIAIVGPTGCGKTTIINLLMRFYDVNSGEICVDNCDIRELTRKSLRAGYGMVLQETYLFAGSIRENICMGNPDASEEDMINAAKAAHCHSFVKRLPNGYDTILSEDGGDLSAGQKQLICIARVMLCMPPMLILDEATSSIDTRTEAKISDAFNKMMEGRTSFIVAHRLSTIRNADVILVMKDGHIIEQGSHQALLEKNGFYTELYNSQFAIC